MLSPVVNVCVHGKIELSNQTTVDLQNKKREEVFVKAKKVVSALLVAAMAASMFTGCGDGTTGADSNSVGDTQSSEDGGVKEFTAFFAVPAGTEINDDNEIQQQIAEIT